MSELKWKSYGDTGLTAEGDKGTWRIVTDGAWWFLSIQPTFTRGMLNKGKFIDRLPAQCHAQDFEDGVEIVAQGEIGT